jgi:hypothetical protein
MANAPRITAAKTTYPDAMPGALVVDGNREEGNAPNRVLRMRHQIIA